MYFECIYCDYSQLCFKCYNSHPSVHSGHFFDEPFDEFEAIYGSGSQPDLASDIMSDHSDEFEYTGTREPKPSDPSA